MKTTQRGFIVPLIIIIIAALGIGGGVYYSKKAKSEKEGAASVQSENEIKSDGDKRKAEMDADVDENNSSNDLSLSGSMKMNVTLEELLKRNSGKNMMCTGSTTTKEGAVVASTTYISGSNIRGDSTTTYKGKVTNGGVIIKNNLMYGWSGNQGVKMMLTAEFNLNTALSMDKSNPSNQKSEYNCNPWTLDESKFTTPSTVKFTDYGSVKIPAVSPDMMKSIMGGKSN